jgi:DNA-binding transcriptional LysR family regulator
MKRVPPLAAIEAFVCAMRSGTFRIAASELDISPSAFSSRIRTLEAHLGAMLFERKGGTIVATEAARVYLAEVGPSIDALRAAGDDGRREAEARGLRVLVAPSLAAEWLMPRLSESLLDASLADVAIEVGEPGCELDPARHDLAILALRTGETGRQTEMLAPIAAAVVAAPVMADRRAPPASPTEIASFDRLDLRFPEGMWRLWSEYSGAPMPRERRDSRFASMATMYEAAAAGFGVALGVPLISERRIRAGALKPCFRGLTPLGFDYRIVYRDVRTRRRPDVRTLTAWLQEAAAESAASFRDLAA